MDLNSLTTKKHIKEAEAHDCELLGAGKSNLYRTYRLPCGHTQEVGLKHMREGVFLCHTCLEQKYRNQARNHGCTIVGPGEGSKSRLYKLPCGHEQTIKVGNMNMGGFRCQTCLTESMTKDAASQGCRLIGKGRTGQHRLYELSCGHQQEVEVGNMKKGTFKCQTCFQNMLQRQAAEQGCKLIGAGKNHFYRLYKLPCGHEQEFKPGHIKDGNFRCAICMQKKLKSEAKMHGCELIGEGRNNAFRTYQLPCGHEQQVQTGAMKIGSFRCQTCLITKLEQEAQKRGCKLIGPASKGADYRLYQLDCGHRQEVNCSRMKEGYFRCQTCEETSRTQPSNVYLLHIKLGADEWLKLGYAKDVESRVNRYGLLPESKVTVVSSVPFKTGNEAHVVEADIHKRRSRKRLKKSQMREFHTSDGFSECYPVIMLDTLLAELKVVKQSQEGKA